VLLARGSQPPGPIALSFTARFAAAASGDLQKYSLYTPELNLMSETETTSNSAPAMAYDYIWFGGKPVAQVDIATSTPHWTFTDHLGTPILQTNASGAIDWRAEYEPFGTVYTLRTGATRHQPLRFPGQEADAADGEREYNIHRWYRSAWGRYTQGDPLGVGGVDHFSKRDYHPQIGPWISKDNKDVGAGDTNLYAYVQGNPVNSIDPDGLATLPNGPSGLGPEWQLDPNHQDPNGERFRDPEGNVLDWHPAHGGKGWKDRDHWHYRPGGKGGKQHLKPGDDIPDNSSSCTIHQDWSQYLNREWWEKKTGLTGWALAAYLILSEGSRLYPPRDLIPVP
jgi:RHS repeat-associated protein